MFTNPEASAASTRQRPASSLSRQRLHAEDVLPRLEGGQGHRHVELVRGADEDGVDLRVLAERPVIDVLVDGLGELASDGRHPRRIEIAERRDTSARVRGDGPGHRGPDSHPDDPETHAVHQQRLPFGVGRRAPGSCPWGRIGRGCWGIKSRERSRGARPKATRNGSLSARTRFAAAHV